jgi:hypothetical protein
MFEELSKAGLQFQQKRFYLLKGFNHGIAFFRLLVFFRYSFAPSMVNFRRRRRS